MPFDFPVHRYAGAPWSCARSKRDGSIPTGGRCVRPTPRRVADPYSQTLALWPRPLEPDQRDDFVNPLGVTGIGELGIAGTAAAVANTIHHTTGKRLRALPFTMKDV